MLFQKNEKYRMLTPNQCQEICDAVFQVLEEVGCLMKNEEARQYMAEAGCGVSGELIKIPREILENAIEKVPHTVTLYNRFGEPTFTLEPGATFMGPHLGCPNTVDLETRKQRPYVEADAANFAKVLEELPEMSWIAASGQISDVDPRVCDVHEARAILSNSTKTVTTWAITPESLNDIFEMCEVASGGPEALSKRPMLFVGMCPVNGLTHGKDEIGVFLTAARRGVPLLYTPGMMSGVQTPITSAASIVMAMCDTMVGLLLSQLVNPGMPFIAAAFSDRANMKTLALTMTNPETHLDNLCIADVFRHLGLPFCTHSTTSDANSFDQQAAADAAIGIYNSILGGCNMVIHSGYLSGGMCSSLELLVYENEVLSMVRQIERGVTINDETLAVDVIKEVGPNGNYLGEEHTIEHYDELWLPQVFNRDGYMKWHDKGEPSLYDIINIKVKKIVSVDPKHPLTREQLDKLDAIVARAEKRVLNN